MKRPEGFDKPAPPPPKPPRKLPRVQKSTAQKQTIQKQTVQNPAANKPKTLITTAKRLRSTDSAEQSSAAGPAKRSVRVASRTRRRYERGEIKRFTRRSRHRRLGWLVGAGLVACLAGLVAIAVYSPLLALRTITVQGTSAVSADAVLKALDGQSGTPLALVNYDLIRQELNAFPLIRSYVTEVVPPHTLVVHIVERSPVGAVAKPTSFSVVDPAGVVLTTSATRPAGMPLITIGSQGTDSVSFKAVVAVLLALPDSIRSKVDTVTASSNDDVMLVLAGAHQRVLWGSSERSALKARVLTELIASRGGAASLEYDVSAPMSPVVRGG